MDSATININGLTQTFAPAIPDPRKAYPNCDGPQLRDVLVFGSNFVDSRCVDFEEWEPLLPASPVSGAACAIGAPKVAATTIAAPANTDLTAIFMGFSLGTRSTPSVVTN